MKKILILTVCAAVSLFSAGCSKNEPEEESESTSGIASEAVTEVTEATEENEEPTEAETEAETEPETEAGTKPTEAQDIPSPKVLEEGQVDEELLGEWYSDETTGIFTFGEDSNFYIVTDYTSLMHFNTDKKLVIGTNEYPAEYNGKKLIVTADSKLLETEESATESETETGTAEIMVLERTGEENTDSINGEYTLTGGTFYQELSDSIFNGQSFRRIKMNISGEKLSAKIEFCCYTADGSHIELYGNRAEILGINASSGKAYNYEISDDVLTLTNEDEEEVIILSRNPDGAVEEETEE